MHRLSLPHSCPLCSLFALVLLASCTDGSTSSSSSTPAAPPASTPSPSPTPAPAPPASSEPTEAPTGPAVTEPVAPTTPEPAAKATIEGDGVCFVLAEGAGGLVRLGASGLFESVRDRGLALANDPEGSLHLLSVTDGAYRIEALSGSGPDLQVEPSVIDVGVRDFVVESHGRTWILSRKGLAHHDGAAWTLTPPEAVGGDPSELQIDAEGTLWVLGPTTLHRRGPDGFEKVEVPAPRLGGFVPGAEEGIAMLGSKKLLRRTKDVWTTLDLDLPEYEGQGVATAVLRRDGTLVGRRLDSAILLVGSPGDPLRALDLPALGVPAGYTYAIASESNGRVWIDTDVGLAVIEPDLTTLARWYPEGSIPVLQGRMVQTILAQGSLPSLPEPGPVDGHVRGMIVAGGEPVAGAKIQMCAQPARGSLGSMGTPCEFDAPDAYGARTRKDGSFDLWGVPPKLYEIAVQRSAGEWSVTDSSPCCKGMESGKVLDLGKVEVGKRANTK